MKRNVLSCLLVMTMGIGILSNVTLSVHATDQQTVFEVQSENPEVLLEESTTEVMQEGETETLDEVEEVPSVEHELEPEIVEEPTEVNDTITVQAEEKTVEIPQNILEKGATATSSANAGTDGGPSFAFDGNPGTAWHSAWDSGYKPAPHSIEFGVGEENMMYKIRKLFVQGKQGGNNGYIKSADIYALGADGQWSKVTSFTFASAEDAKKGKDIVLNDVLTSRLKITVNETYNENHQKLVHIGEIRAWKVEEPGVPGKPAVDYHAKDDWKIIVKFEDENNLAGIRSSTLPMTLENKTNGESKQLTAQTYNDSFIKSPYTFTFRDMPRYVQKKGETKWTASDYEPIPGRYTAAYDIKVEKTGETEFTVTYALEHRYVDKTISVNWVNVKAEERPALQVQLVKQQSDGFKAYEVGKPVTLSAENNWTYTWQDVLEYPTNKEKTTFRPHYGILSLEPVEEYQTSYSGVKDETIFDQTVYRFDDQGQLVITNAVQADKLELQELYDKVKDFESTSGWFDDFTKELKETEKLLADEKATQSQIDTAVSTLEQRYYLCKVGEYSNKYRAKKSSNKDLFPYENYTRESVLPMLQVWGKSSDVNKNTKVEELKQWYQEFQDAEKALTLLPKEPRGVWSGPENLYMESNFTNTFKGSFHVTETPAENGKINLHVEFYNDGTQPYTGEKLEPYPYYQMGSEKMTGDKISAQYGYRTYDGPDYLGDWGKPRHLDGEDNFVKGYQMDLSNVDPGRYYFSMSTRDYKGKVHSVGYYYTKESVTVTTHVNGKENNIPLFKGEALGELFPTNPIKEGYQFMGWNTSKDGTGTNVTAETTFDQDTTMYPIFKENLVASAVYSNIKDDKVEPLYNGSVTVTITANKEIESLVVVPTEESVQEDTTGWKKVDEKTFVKIFQGNEKELVRVKDADGFETDINVQVQGIIIDTTKPEITVDEAGTVTVVDEYLASVTVDGEPVQLDEKNQYILSAGKHKVVATDFAGNVNTWEGEILKPDVEEGEKPGEEQKPGGGQSQEDDKKPGSGQSQEDDKKPGNGQKPADDKKPGSGETKQPEQKENVAVKSGDDNTIVWYVGLLLGCAMIFGILIYRRKYNR